MSTPGEVAVTPAELVAAAAAIRNLLDGLSGGFGSLDKDVTRLTDTWKGSQGEQFAAGFAEVRDGVAALLDAIRDTTVALDASSEAYLGQDGVNAAAIESVALSLDLPGVS
ncbi:WXG100 family type VII secretion target [Nocardia rhizosphaerihabitans]|uniref:WXG100 family type VII secretion target n=1 Tax=Nocardia rhizosphaerihabitans TaxID=1691570 RepID=UPI00366C05C0